MERFTAEVKFSFEAETIESAGGQLRRLAEAAANAGFDMTDGVVVPGAEPIDNSGWTPYGPAPQ
jgi:hypothetical protein